MCFGITTIHAPVDSLKEIYLIKKQTTNLVRLLQTLSRPLTNTTRKEAMDSKRKPTIEDLQYGISELDSKMYALQKYLDIHFAQGAKYEVVKTYPVEEIGKLSRKKWWQFWK